MGVTVRQKDRGRGNPWWVFTHVNGLIRSKKVGDKRAAEVVASALRRKLKAGELAINAATASPKTPEFSAYATRYLDGYAKTACKRNTWTGYEAIVRLHLTPVWKGKRLDQITRADVKRLLLQKQQEGLSSGTVENIKALVSGIFTHAYEDEILTVNPALKLGKYIKMSAGTQNRPVMGGFRAATRRRGLEHSFSPPAPSEHGCRALGAKSC